MNNSPVSFIGNGSGNNHWRSDSGNMSGLCGGIFLQIRFNYQVRFAISLPRAKSDSVKADYKFSGIRVDSIVVISPSCL